MSVLIVYLPRPRIEISGSQGVQAIFDWQTVQDTGGGPMATIVLVNPSSAAN